MSEKDRQQFKDAVAKAKSTFFEDWKPAVHAASRLAMFDMLAALAAISKSDREMLVRNAMAMFLPGSKETFSRIEFAASVIDNREIYDLGLPEDQINDGRDFLGCTRLDSTEVQNTINDALNQARVAIRENRKGTGWATLGGDANQCCGVYAVAWTPILVEQRRAFPGASLLSNLAAAAHYMLARFHVCAGRATINQMKTVIDSYDAKKRIAIMSGDQELKTIALTKDNRPFPPDFAIRDWAYKGATAGEVDRLRCNSKTSPPVVFPDINGSEA
jgi:hypothetical protein